MIIGYQTIASNGDRYAVFVNADSKARTVVLPDRYRHLLGAQVLVDAEQAGVTAIAKPKGVQFTKEGLTIDGLTAIVLKVAAGAVEAPSQTQQARSEQSVRPVSTTVSKASPLMTPDQKPQQASLPQTGEMTSKGLLATGMTMLIAVLGSLLSVKKTNHRR